MYVIVVLRNADPIQPIVIDLPDGADEDEVFVEWMKDVYGDECEGLTDDEILKLCPTRWVCEVLSV